MNELIKVSVIMSVYNGELYIRDAVKSILDQTYKNFEYIIIDDCSTDRTVAYLEEFNDNRIVLIKNKSRHGLTYNLNRMIEISKGSYIVRLDADDISTSDRLEILVSYMDMHQSCICACSYAQMFGDDNKLLNLPKSSDELLVTLLYRNVITHSTVIFRNEDIYYDESFKKSQDFELWNRFVLSGKHIGIIPRCLVLFRVHKNQISNTSTGEQKYYSDLIKKRSLDFLNVTRTKNEEDNYIQFAFDGEVKTTQQFESSFSILEQMRNSIPLKLFIKKRIVRKALSSEYTKLWFSIYKHGIPIKNQKKIATIKRAFSIQFLKVCIYKIVKSIQ